MVPAFSLERHTVVLGALAGSVMIFLVWVLSEAALRLVTRHAPLPFNECLDYAGGSVLPGFIMGAATAQSWRLAHQGQGDKARLICLLTGTVVGLSYIIIAVCPAFQPISENFFISAGIAVVGGRTIPLWLFQFINLFLTRNLPFLLSVLMVMIALLWPSRRSMAR